MICIISIIIADYKERKRKKGTSSEYPQQNFNHRKGQPTIWSEFSKAPSCSKKNITTSGLGSFMEKLLAEELSEKTTSLITDARKAGTHSHYESAW